MPNTENGVTLGALISSLRAELQAAQKEGAGEDFRFTIDDIELELEVMTERSADPNISVKFWVVNAGVGGSVGDRHTHRIKLKLKPSATNQDNEIGAERTK